MDGRHGQETSADYRYGFQGQEDDPEIKGKGNSTNYKYRMHDPRIGRFFAVDPLTLKYPELTPYQFSSNSPIGMVEIEGLEGEWKFDIQEAQRAQSQALDNGASHETSKKVFQHTLNTLQPFRNMPDEAAFMILIGLDYILTGGSITYGVGMIYGLSETGSEMNATDNYHEAVANGDKKSADKYAQQMKDHGPGTMGAFVEFLPLVTYANKLGFFQKIGVRIKRWFTKDTRKIIGTDYDEIRPAQDWINREKVEEYKEIILSGEDTAPIDVYTYQGNKYIEDGHHRFVAYKELGIEPNIREHSFGGPQGLKDWKGVEEVETYIDH